MSADDPAAESSDDESTLSDRRRWLERWFVPNTAHGWLAIPATLVLGLGLAVSGETLAALALMIYPVLTFAALWSQWSRDNSWRDGPWIG